MLVVLAAPAINACAGDDRGLLTCVRGLIDDRFELGLEADTGPAPAVVQPVAIDAPAPVEPAPELQLAEATVPIPAIEPARSLVAPAPEKPIAPPATPPKVIPAPRVAAIPDLPTIEPEVEAPVSDEIAPPPIAAPIVTEAVPVEAPPVDVPPVEIPSAEAPPAEAPSVEVPLDEPPAYTVAKSPDVTTVPTLDPAPEPDADPWFAPPAPTALPDGPLPLITAPVAAEPEPAAPDTKPAAATTQEPDEAPVVTPPIPEPPSVASIPDTGVIPEVPVPVAGPDPAPVEMPPILPPAPPVEPEATVAAIDPVIPDDPEPAARVLAPTIDAIEIDGDGNFIAGNGPAGATMRLYVDGLPVGISPVEGGRWLVEGADLLIEEQQVLKVEALDPLTGRVLGEASIVFEGPIGVATTPVVESQAAEEPKLEVEPAPATELPDASIEQPVPNRPPAPLPQIVPVVPAVESPSVIILRPTGDAAIETLPTGEPSTDAVLSLGKASKSPAILAQFTIPDNEPGLTVLRAVPVGDPGAGRFVSGKAIIRRGDTLWDIAHRFYGRGVHYRTIFRANREAVPRPSRIYPGQVLDLPLVYDD
jgi:nucleoid-associated protein YgaU